MSFMKMNTSYPARIVSFDPTDQTATIKIALEAFVSNVEEMYLKMEFANITKVPVHFPQCGNYAITFPIKVGDDCLAVFTQRGFEHWLYEAKMEAGLNPIGLPTASHMRAYSKNDAMAFVGFNPIPNAIQNFSPENLEIRSKDMSQFISIRPSGDMEVTTPSNITINAGSTIVNSPTVTVNSDTVEVNASMTTVNGDFTVNGNSAMNGNVAISGGLSVPNASAGGATIAKATVTNATITSATIGGIKMETHTHKAQGANAETSSPH